MEISKLLSQRKMPIRPKLCGNCAFPQNFHTRKLGETTAFHKVFASHGLTPIFFMMKPDLLCDIRFFFQENKSVYRLLRPA